MRAFTNDPIMRWLYPDDEVFLAPGGEIFRNIMGEWLRHNEVWTTDQSTALAVWLPPGRPELPPDPDSKSEPGSQSDSSEQAPEMPSELAQRVGLLIPLMDEHTPKEEHWYLQLLAAHPDWQRQGLGAELMAVQFERADSEGLPCYLETQTPQNVPYYRHYGFEVRSEWDVDPDGTLGEPGPHMWGMLRPSP
jgi:ribosomal protein S18 acetylase RimI-like enzyme